MTPPISLPVRKPVNLPCSVCSHYVYISDFADFAEAAAVIQFCLVIPQ